jgi:hypothetical protein
MLFELEIFSNGKLYLWLDKAQKNQMQFKVY